MHLGHASETLIECALLDSLALSCRRIIKVLNMSKREISKGPKSERKGSVYPHDEDISDRLDVIVKEFERPIQDVLESFPVYARRIHLTRFLAHYELYKQVADLPGSIFECGVYRGSGLFTWAKLLEIFHPGDRLRKVIGFDNFEGFVSFHSKDGAEQQDRAKTIGGWNAGDYYPELLKHIDIFHEDSFLPRATRIELVAGDLAQSASKYVSENPGTRISLLHLDVDLYEPTIAALKAFYPLVVEGGLIVLDEYGIKDWPGASQAVEEYFSDQMPRIQKLPYCSSPGGYIVKGS